MSDKQPSRIFHQHLRNAMVEKSSRKTHAPLYAFVLITLYYVNAAIGMCSRFFKFSRKKSGVGGVAEPNEKRSAERIGAKGDGLTFWQKYLSEYRWAVYYGLAYLIVVCLFALFVFGKELSKP